MNADSRQFVEGYYFVVSAHDNPSARRVKSLYPDILETDADYYTRVQLEAMRDVIALIPANLPEL
jgi:hypothetical protein